MCTAKYWCEYQQKRLVRGFFLCAFFLGCSSFRQLMPRTRTRARPCTGHKSRISKNGLRLLAGTCGGVSSGTRDSWAGLSFPRRCCMYLVYLAWYRTRRHSIESCSTLSRHSAGGDWVEPGGPHARFGKDPAMFPRAYRDDVHGRTVCNYIVFLLARAKFRRRPKARFGGGPPPAQ